MTLLILLLAAMLVLTTTTVHLTRRDGRGPAAPPRSRHDPTFDPPGSRWANG